MVINKVLIILALLSSFANADIFSKNRASFGVSLGAGYSYGNTYTLVGLSGNYFVVDNLSIGVSYRGWFGATPMQNELALSTNYFIPVSQKFRPYLGAFVRETFVEGYDNYESYGARGGVAMINKNSYVSIGYAYEQFSSCRFNNECSSSYPELVFGLSF